MDNIINAVVETPKGSTLKYDFDPKKDKYKLGKFLPLGMSFPFDFGFIPKTKGEDGDPLDVIFLSEAATFPGCLVCCRIIGCMEAKQSKKEGSRHLVRNDRFLAVPEESLAFKHIRDIGDVPKETYRELTDFFANYNKIAKKDFKETGKIGVRASLRRIAKGSTQKKK